MSKRVSPSVRQAVKGRSHSRCEYCRKPDQTSLYSSHADHIIPPLHGGDSKMANLAWACFQCNVNKGPNIASYDPDTGELTPLFNPRTQQWDDHFEMDGAVIKGKTAVGRVTVQILQMNDPEQIKTRQRLINAGQW